MSCEFKFLKKPKKRQIFSELHWFARFRLFDPKRQIGLFFDPNRFEAVENPVRFFQPEPLIRTLNPHRGPCISLLFACFGDPISVGEIVVSVVHTHGFSLFWIDY
jgi:hypothetical protein